MIVQLENKRNRWKININSDNKRNKIFYWRIKKKIK